ncbi:hypothetical protein HYW18_00960 [Candidatus Uhrbacteria bacterium]|nr:hypothetical protein [Candidatus Uhrbacteria bacterium]
MSRKPIDLEDITNYAVYVLEGHDIEVCPWQDQSSSGFYRLSLCFGASAALNRVLRPDSSLTDSFNFFVKQDHLGLSPADTARLYGTGVRKMVDTLSPKGLVVAVDVNANPEAAAMGIVYALQEANYFQTDMEIYRGLTTVRIMVDGEAFVTKAERGVEIARLGNLQRCLATVTPTDEGLSTDGFAELVERLWKGREFPEMVEYVGTEEMGLINAVCRGSGRSGQVLRLTVHPTTGETTTRDVIIGKGLVFDDGGQVSKGEHMAGMGGDKMGALGCLGVALYFGQHPDELTRTLEVILVLAENRTDGNAYLMDEILTSFGGKRVRVTHPDAEGRLVLADAIEWAHANFSDIASLQTMATLTGAAVTALGQPFSAMFVNDNYWERMTELKEAGERAADRVWPMPMDPYYANLLLDPVADLRNTGKKKEGGPSLGAMFLAAFHPKDWPGEFIHLDIAGSTALDFAGGTEIAEGLPRAAGIAFTIERLRKK